MVFSRPKKTFLLVVVAPKEPEMNIEALYRRGYEPLQRMLKTFGYTSSDAALSEWSDDEPDAPRGR